MEEYQLDKNHIPTTKLSVIVPARNEALTIGNLLRSLQAQNYPSHLVEIIVVDDHSDDDTAQIIQSFPSVKYINLADYTGNQKLNSYKKKAIETAIKQSSGELIITTDADCTMKSNWLLSIVCYYETFRFKMIAAPVEFNTDGSLFQLFQSLDFMTMQGITAAITYTKSGTMCNGANLAYTRQAFDTVDGFKGIDHIASGDDMLLMYKIEQRFPKKTSYLKCKDAIVYTEPMYSIKTFFNQRIRWASKATHFKDKRIIAVLAMVYFFNFLFIALSIYSLFKPAYLFLLFTLLVGKIIIELMLLKPVSTFFKKEKELITFPILQLIHIPYIVISGLLGQFGSYKWKERTVK